MNSYIIKHNKIKRFMLAGNAYITVVNKQTKNQVKFHIVRPREDTPWFVWAPNKKNKYCFLGTIFPRKNTTEYHWSWKRGKFTEKSIVNSSFKYLWKKILSNSLPDSIMFYRDTRCGKCGKRLTNPKSIKNGFGPYCFSILRKEWEEKKERYT